jgi:serine/threonine protein kinase
LNSIGNVPAGEIIAVRCTGLSFDSSNIVSAFLTEVGNLASLDHPSCLKLIAFSKRVSADAKTPELAVITKWMPNGSLEDVLVKKGNRSQLSGWNETKKSMCIFGMAAGLRYLHSRGLIHRGLRPSNVLLNERLEPVLDVSRLSRFYQPDTESALGIDMRSCSAPELPMDYCGYYDQCNTTTDVYAYGACLIALCQRSLRSSWGSHRLGSLGLLSGSAGLIEEIVRPDGINDFCWELITKCCSKNPSERPTADEIVRELRSHRAEYALEGTNLCELESYENSLLDFERLQSMDRELHSHRNTKDVSLPLFTIESTYYEIADRPEGSGTFGEVFKGNLLKEVNSVPVGQEIAVKITINDEGTDFENSDFRKQLLREIEVLASLNHPSCLKLIAFSFRGSLERPRPAIITKWMSNGGLDNAIKKELDGDPIAGWNATKKSICVFGLVTALKYIHSRGIIHRDIKLANILLNENFEPVLCDFGLSKFYQAGMANTMEIGTPLYMAPELFSDDYDEPYTNAIDIYAYGIYLLLLFTKELRFSSGPPTWKSAQNYLLRVAKGDRFARPEGMNDFCWTLSVQCLAHNPNDRPTAAQIVERLSSNRSEYALDGTNLCDLEVYENSVIDLEQRQFVEPVLELPRIGAEDTPQPVIAEPQVNTKPSKCLYV